MSKVLSLLACASLIATAACATPATQVAAPEAAPTAEAGSEGSAYGLFLAGRAAMIGGDNTDASTYLERSAGMSGSASVREQAFIAAVLAGDLDRASDLSPPATASAGVLRLSRLLEAVQSLAKGRGKAAYKALSGDAAWSPHVTAATLLTPWAAASAGDWKGATAEPDTKADRLTFTLASRGRAQLLERAQRYDEAEAVLKTMSAEEGAGAVFAEAYGGFLERRGRHAEALAVYDKMLVAAPDDAGTVALRARALAKKPPPVLPDLRVGASEAMIGSAAAALLAKQTDVGLVYLRFAIALDPQSDEAWLMVGDTLSAQSKPEEARAAYAKVRPDSSAYVQARTRAVWTYSDDTEQPLALALARQTAQAAPASVLAQMTLADVLRTNKRYAESAAVLDTVIASQGKDADWRLYYLRALALDKAGRWTDAERDLKTGLAMRPDEAEMLNYLGYTWITRGERLDEALGMVQKAAAAEPNSGAVIDSLGWAYFSLGQYPKAVEHLERASQLEPADAEINAHLGDAYWRTGRRVEARFQWSKVLSTMKPDAALKAELEARLKDGLAPVAAAKVARN